MIDDDDPMVFCDGRLMRRSEMRRLVAEDMARFAQMDAARGRRAARSAGRIRDLHS